MTCYYLTSWSWPSDHVLLKGFTGWQTIPKTPLGNHEESNYCAFRSCRAIVFRLEMTRRFQVCFPAFWPTNWACCGGIGEGRSWDVEELWAGSDGRVAPPEAGWVTTFHSFPRIWLDQQVISPEDQFFQLQRFAAPRRFIQVRAEPWASSDTIRKYYSHYQREQRGKENAARNRKPSPGREASV